MAPAKRRKRKMATATYNQESFQDTEDPIRKIGPDATAMFDGSSSNSTEHASSEALNAATADAEDDPDEELDDDAAEEEEDDEEDEDEDVEDAADLENVDSEY
jgi:hypothetical protein